MGYLKIIIGVLKNDGVIELFLKIARRIKFHILPYFDYWFDLRHGIDTCRVVFHDTDADISPENSETALRYEASPVKAVRSIFKTLSIDYSLYTFIDYGSGKGRVLFLASEYPFRNIIGVELSGRLHRIAGRNLKMSKNFNQKCNKIDMFCADAVDFKLPEEPLILYFFTPFHGSIMERVVDNIQKSLQAVPRSMHIVWYGKRHDVMNIFLKMKNFTCREIHLERLLSASGDYKCRLFSFNVSK